MKADEEKRIRESFIRRLSGNVIEGDKAPFENYGSASKSVGKMKIPAKLQNELRALVGEKYGRVPGAKPEKPAKAEKPNADVPKKFDKFVAKGAPPVRTPVYGTIPDTVAAKLTFLEQAITANVDIIHGLKEAKEAHPEADVSEIQSSINRLMLLSQQHESEINFILSNVFAPTGGGFTPPPAPSPADGTETSELAVALEESKGNGAVTPQVTGPALPGLGRSPFVRPQAVARNPIGFRVQTEADQKEVDMLKRTAPRYNGPNGPMTC